MHYIVGTEIVTSPVRKQPIQPGMTSAQIKNRSTGLSPFSEQRELLTPGVTYTLLRVYVTEQKPCYVFSGDGQRVELIFDSVSTAEKFISELRQESLPDYESINRDKTD